MADLMSARRLSASRRLARFVSSQAGRRVMETNGFRSGTPMLAAHESELMADVFDRATRYDVAAPEVVVLVHFPDRKPGEDVEIVAWEKRATAPVPGEDDSLHVGPGSAPTIGMIADVVSGRKRSYDVTAVVDAFGPRLSVYA